MIDRADELVVVVRGGSGGNLRPDDAACPRLVVDEHPLPKRFLEHRRNRAGRGVDGVSRRKGDYQTDRPYGKNVRSHAAAAAAVTASDATISIEEIRQFILFIASILRVPRLDAVAQGGTDSTPLDVNSRSLVMASTVAADPCSSTANYPAATALAWNQWSYPAPSKVIHAAPIASRPDRLAQAAVAAVLGF